MKVLLITNHYTLAKIWLSLYKFGKTIPKDNKDDRDFNSRQIRDIIKHKRQNTLPPKHVMLMYQNWIHRNEEIKKIEKQQAHIRSQHSQLQNLAKEVEDKKPDVQSLLKALNKILQPKKVTILADYHAEKSKVIKYKQMRYRLNSILIIMDSYLKNYEELINTSYMGESMHHLKILLNEVHGINIAMMMLSPDASIAVDALIEEKSQNRT